MSKNIRILHLEDDVADFELVKARLLDEGLPCDVTRVDTREKFIAALQRGRYDLILSDFSLPFYNGKEALDFTLRHYPLIPFIYVSGTIGEDAAIDALTAGATDYVLKGNLKRLVPAIRKAVQDAENVAERRRLDDALRAERARMETVTRSISVGMAVISRDFRTVWANSILRSIFGDTVGKPCYEVYNRRNDICSDCGVKRVFATGEQFVIHEQAGRDMNNNVVWSQIIASPIRNAAGEIIEALEIVVPITERKLLENQLRQSQKMESIGRLAGGVAHDFNNILTVILGYSNLFQKALKPDDPYREDIDEIVKATNRAASLTRQLLAFSRRQVLEPKLVILNSIITDIEKMLRRLIGEDIDLIIALAPKLGIVKVDPGQMEQVIMNLAVNARDAMPKGGKIIIETADVVLDDSFTQKHPSLSPLPPGNYVMLTISDTGVGMDAETQARIFEPFFTTKELGKGTGLGLSTVYGIVRQSGGGIWVYSEPGRGTSFKIYFPRAERPLESSSSQIQKATSASGSETILLVEDDEIIRRISKRVLIQHGYVVLEASSSEEALKLVCRKKPADLVLTDLVLPGKDGVELAQILVQNYDKTKVLFMSGYTDRAVFRQEIFELHNFFIQKPFTPDMLAQKIREVLDSPRPKNLFSNEPQ